MMDEKKKKMDNPKLAVLIAMKAKKKAMEGEGGRYEDAASEIIDAVESKDAKGLAESLKAFIEMCVDELDGGDEGSEEEEAY